MRTVAVGTVLTVVALIGLPAPSAAQPAGETVTFTEHVAPISVDGDGVCRPIVQLRRLGLRVPRDLLRVLAGAPVRQVRR